MAFIDQIVGKINTSIDTVLTAYKRNVKGVCDITNDGEDRLYLRTATGEEFAVLDDNYSIVLFHLAEQTSYSPLDDQFGEADDMYQSQTSIELIAYAYEGANLNNRSLASLIVSALPSEITLDNQTDKGLYQTIIEVQTSNYNSVEVFSKLYPGVEYAVPPKDCLVSVIYTVTSSINRTCLPTCLNC